MFDFRPAFSPQDLAQAQEQRRQQQMQETMLPLQAMGQIMGNFRQQRAQDATLALQRRQDAREQAKFHAEYDPQGPMPGGGSPGMAGAQPGNYVDWAHGVQGPEPGPVDFQPSYQGPQPQGAMDYSQGQQGPQPAGAIDHTAHFNNWKQMGQPSLYDHHELGGQGIVANGPVGQPEQNPGQRMWSQYQDVWNNPGLSLFQKKAYGGQLKEAGDAYKAFRDPGDYETFIPKSKALTMAGGPKNSKIIDDTPNVTLGERSDQFAQREWDKIVHDTDPTTATTRSLLGRAGVANFQANRALKTLSNPMITNVEAGNVMADVAALYQGGSPTEFGMSHQAYQTLYGKMQGAIQSLSGKPQDAVPQAIKERLISVLSDMKNTNAGVIKQKLDLTERAKAKIIAKFPDDWKKLRDTLEGDQTPYNGLGGGGEAGTMTPDVIAYAQKHNITTSEALRIKQVRTGGAL